MSRPYVLEIQVPAKLLELLNSGGANNSAISKVIAEFSAWLADNKTPLFFEYTDHGIAHVTNVLNSVVSLIPEQVWGSLNAYDAEAILSAVLLHDCAMHLSVDGFRSLLNSDAPKSKIFGDEPSWADEYRRFEQEAVRWDSKRLVSVFGDADPVQPIGDALSLSDRQKLLVGEFMRRNHARLAHEIALEGVPGPLDARGKFDPFSELPEQRRDLYGFLARSHNMAIRDAVDRLQRISRRQYLEVHCPYVMALLRIADYIQIDSARAPTQILQLRGLKSPVSRHEWAKHHAVLELHQWGDDPEALNVIAYPDTVTIFVGLRRLFSDLQREMDESWATLGEVYGRVPQLAQLGLTVRRLVSNLDDPAAYEKEAQPQYLPQEIRLTTSSAELLHLLVGPLYGNRPSVGVRELVQNAVDACLEMEHQASLSEFAYTPLIEVEVDANMHGKGGVRITDNGVGMTIETLNDYFLKAGASFRRSAWWAAEYATEQNKSEVRRSGRFGVGSLAAFLIGPRITVTTRNFSDTSGAGYRFSVSADDDLLEVSRVKCEVGTSIEITVADRNVVETLVKESPDFADWYIYHHPRIIYRENSSGDWKEHPRRWTKAEDNNEGWIQFSAPNFQKVEWKPVRRGDYGHVSGRLACNGIFVTEGKWRKELPEISISPGRGAFQVVHPDLLVDDRDGRLPLNVQRDGLAEPIYPFQREFELSIASVYVKKLVDSIGCVAEPSNLKVCSIKTSRVRSELAAGNSFVVGIWKGGWVPLETEVLKSLGINRFLLDYCENQNVGGVITALKPDELSEWVLAPVNLNSVGMGYVLGRLRNLIENDRSDEAHQVPYLVGKVAGMRIFLREEVVASAKRKGIPNFLWRSLTEFGMFNGWTVYDFGDTSGFEAECDWNLRCERLTSLAPDKSRMFAFVDYAELGERIGSAFYEEWIKAVPETLIRLAADIAADAKDVQEELDDSDEVESESED